MINPEQKEQKNLESKESPKQQWQRPVLTQIDLRQTLSMNKSDG